MSAGGTGGVGGRREKTAALADECGSRCGARAATLTDEELEGGTGGTGSLSAHTGGPIAAATAGPACAPGSPYASHQRARLDEAVVVPPGGFWVRQTPCGTPRIGAVVDQLALSNRVAPRVDRCGSKPAAITDPTGAAAFRLAVMLDGWRPAHVFQRREISSGRCYEGWR